MRNRRIVVTRYGGPNTLRMIEEECPEPKRGEVRVRVLAAGVGFPDVMAREGAHPETPKVPFTPGWDLVGVVEKLGNGVAGIDLGQTVLALPISGAYAEFVCLPERELIFVPPGMDPAEVVSLGLNYVTAYQMLHRFAEVSRGKRVLVHGAAGGVGTALLQLASLEGAETYGTCSALGASTVVSLGATPIDYQHQDFVKETRRLTGDGVDAVFDSMGGAHLWRSLQTLRRGGKVIAYGLAGSFSRGQLASRRSGHRNRLRGVPMIALYVLGAPFLPGRKRVVPYSIQWLKRLRPALFRRDLATLVSLLERGQIKPLVAYRLPLAEACHAHQLLGQGRVTGKIVLLPGDLAATDSDIARTARVPPPTRTQAERNASSGDQLH